MFLMILISTITLGLSSNNFLTLWFSMELNLIFFIPIILGMKSSQEAESTVKYFLVQSISSSLFLFSCLFNLYSSKTNMFMNFIMIISILTKLGIAPFHMWFPSVLANMSWKNLFLTSVFQKIIPLYLIFIISLSNFNLMLISMMNIFIGALSGFSQFCLKKIMAFSSISHMSWMIISIKINGMIFLFYFVFYTVLMMELIMFFDSMSLNYLSDMSMKKDSSSLHLIFSSKMLSLGGLPPFLGFYPKAAVVYIMVKEKMIWVPFMMTLLSAISIFIYTRTIFSSLIITFNLIKTMKSEYSLKKTNWFFLIYTEIFILFTTYLMFMTWTF